MFNNLARTSTPHRSSLSVVIGFVLLLVTALFIAANVLEYELGIPITWSPFHAIYDSNESSLLTYFVDGLIVFGPLFGFAALVVPLIRVRWFADEQMFALTTSIQKTSWIHLWMIAIYMITFAVLGTYLMAENLPCVLGQRTIC